MPLKKIPYKSVHAWTLYTQKERLDYWHERISSYAYKQHMNMDLMMCFAFFSDLQKIYYKRPLWDRLLKRGLDIVFSLVVLALAMPALVIIAGLIKFDSRGPVFYRQLRIGLMGMPFEILKFRTMVVDAEAVLVGTKAMEKLNRDPRVTRIGNFLREWRIDELPQAINVLRGEMSWVGPRPMFIEESALANDTSYVRFAAVPGITGLWQATKSNRIDGYEKQRLDAEYALKQNIFLDIKLMLMTVPKMLFKESWSAGVSDSNRSNDTDNQDKKAA